jgi:sigma-B regulation protein RsbQ
MNTLSLPAPNALLPSLSPAAQAVCQRHHVRVVGQGTQTLLFCNGFNCNQQVWNYLTPNLATRYRLVLYDQIGTGQADLAAYDPQKYATVQGYVQDLLDICQALDLEQVVVIGHSLGATIALLAAIQAPHYFAKVILVAASPCYLNEPGYYGGFEKADMLAMIAEMDKNYRNWANLFAQMMMGSEANASLGHELAGYFCESDPTVARQAIRFTFFDDHRAALPQAQLPVLLVQSADDVAVPSEVNDYWLAHLPQAQLVTLATTGHCPHMSAPREMLAAMQHFLQAPAPSAEKQTVPSWPAVAEERSTARLPLASY